VLTPPNVSVAGIGSATGAALTMRGVQAERPSLYDLRAKLRAIVTPVLVLAGDHDKVEPLGVLTEHLLPLIPTASLTVLNDTGHLSPLEVPGQVASHITKFVSQL